MTRQPVGCSADHATGGALPGRNRARRLRRLRMPGWCAPKRSVVCKVPGRRWARMMPCRAQALYQQVLAERPDDPDATWGSPSRCTASASWNRHEGVPAQPAPLARERNGPHGAAGHPVGVGPRHSREPPAGMGADPPARCGCSRRSETCWRRQDRWAEALGPLTQAQSLAPSVPPMPTTWPSRWTSRAATKTPCACTARPCRSVYRAFRQSH